MNNAWLAPHRHALAVCSNDPPLSCRYHGDLSDGLGSQDLAQAWLPPCTTKLRLLNVGCVPGVCQCMHQLKASKPHALTRRHSLKRFAATLVVRHLPSRLREVPGVVAHLPRLRRWAGQNHACMCWVAGRPSVHPLAA